MQTFDFDSTGRQVNARGNFIRYEKDNAGAVNPGVRVRADGNDLGVWLPGDWCELPEPASLVELVPVGLAEGEFRIGMGRFGAQRFALVGTINANIVTNRNPNVVTVQSVWTITPTSLGVIGIKSTRQYLLIQNKDQVGTIWVGFSLVVTQANGIRIGPGESWEWATTIPVGSVNLIGDIASNPNIITLEI